MQESHSVNWRDHLAVHPAAEAYPLLAEKELKQLAGDIQRNGLRADFVLWRPDDKTEPALLDGRNRLDALARIGRLALNGQHLCIKGVDGSLRQVTSFCTITGGDPEKHADSLNLWRRHLTAEQKRDLVARLLKTNPSKSDRQVARAVKASPTFVGKVRAESEATGDVSTVDTRTDTKGRKQPAKKTAKTAPTPNKSEETSVAREARARAMQDVGPASASELERLRARNEELKQKVRRLEIENVGLRSEVEELKTALAATAAAPKDVPVPKKRGRPKGSKNRSKLVRP